MDEPIDSNNVSLDSFEINNYHEDSNGDEIENDS
jgi:hypothetical protein